MTERIEGVYSAPMLDCAKKRISLKFVNNCLLFLLFVCGVYYITTINDMVVKSFVVQDLKVKERVLNEDNLALNTRAIAYKSCDNISKRIEKLGMVTNDKIDYIKVGRGVLASK